MSQENLSHVVSGALFDLMAFATTRDKQVVLSAYDDASAAVELLQDFAKAKGLDIDNPFTEWRLRCGCATAAEKPV